MCLVAARKGDRVIEVPCRHVFHQKCLEPWLKKSTVCPNCRRDVLEQNHLPDLKPPQQIAVQDSPLRRVQQSPAARSEIEESKGEIRVTAVQERNTNSAEPIGPVSGQL